jgi:hypothetical protein
MFCYFCGKENDDKQKFCKYCGKSLHPTKQDENKPAESKKEEITERPKQFTEFMGKTEQSKEFAPVNITGQSGVETVDNGSVTNKLLIAVIVLLALILVALGLCLVVYIRSGAVSPLEMFVNKSEQTEVEALSDENVDNTGSADPEAKNVEPYKEKTDKAAEAAGSDEKAEVEDTKDDSHAMGNIKADQTAEDKTEVKQSGSLDKEGSENADNDGESKKKSTDEQDDNVDNESGDTAESTKVKLKILSAEASSVLNATSKDHATYVAGNVCDGNFKTAWVEGVAGNGEGQILIVHLDGVHKVSKIKIFNGYLKTKRRYAINGRVTNAVIDYGNGYRQAVDLKVMNPPEVEIEFAAAEMGETEIIPDAPCETDTIAITIMGVQSGSKYTDTAISEIEVYGD